MLLAIDVGNTNMVFGIYDGDELVGSLRLETIANRTSDEIGIMLCQYFMRFGIEATGINDVIVASVVPQVMHALTNAIKKYICVTPIIVDEDIFCNPDFDGDSDERLGADRAVAIVAALEKYGAPLIVVDFGTATTFDAIAPDGKYVGGAIGAGLKITLDALVSSTAMLPTVELIEPGTVMGMNTVGQIQAGVVSGYVGNIEYITKRMEAEMQCDNVTVVATGGLARMISECTDCVDVVDAQLILDGLKILYNRYQITDIHVIKDIAPK